MGVVTLFHFFLLPKVEVARPKKTVREDLIQFGRSFATYVEQDRVWFMLLFVIMYRLGDELLLSMSTPFLMRELAVTKTQMAWLGSFVAAGSTVAGAMVGSWWIAKVGLKKAIWPLTLLMNLNMWAYIALAYFKPQATNSQGLLIIAITHGYEMMAAGLGNAVMMVYLMRTCKPEYKAGHYAVGSALTSLGGIVLGGFAGKIVEGYGYVNLYLLSFALAALAMPLLFFIPHLDNRHSK
jgi:PAT family beta-lactamase induction signal transducer AmpG